MKINRLESLRCRVGESPVWDAGERALFLLDIAGQQIHRYDPIADAVNTWTTPAPATALALGPPGQVLLAMQNAIHSFDLQSRATSLVATAEGQAKNATLNDGRVDRQGRFVVGSCCTDFSAPTPVGGIYGFDRGRCRRLAGNITFSNGTCFSPDGATLYFADCALSAVFAYPYDIATGSVSERRLLADTTGLGGMPDGATVDRDGKIWIAINQAGKVAAYDPDGALARVIDLPATRPGSVSFGGANLDQLFVTTLDPAYFGEAPDEAAGYVYRIDGLGAVGLPEPRYRE